MKQAIKNAVNREPNLETIIEKYQETRHPFQAK